MTTSAIQDSPWFHEQGWTRKIPFGLWKIAPRQGPGTETTGSTPLEPRR